MKAASCAWLIVALAIGCASGCARMFRAEPVEVAQTGPTRVDVDGQAWDSQKTSPEQVIAQRKAQVEQAIASREQDFEVDVPHAPQDAASAAGSAPAPQSAHRPTHDAASAPAPRPPAPLVRTSAPPPLSRAPAATPLAPSKASQPMPTAETSAASDRPVVQATAADNQGRLVAILRSADGQTHMAREGGTLLMTLDGAPAALKVEHISDGRVRVRRGEEPIILQ